MGQPVRALLAAETRCAGPTSRSEPAMSEVALDATYPHPPERVWRALTEPQELAAWLMPNDFAPVVGHRFQFKVKPQLGWRGIVDCEVLEVDRPRTLSYSWQGDPKYRVT